MEELTCFKCGLIAYPETKKNGPHLTAFCSGCGNYLKHLQTPKSNDFTLYFGKYKDRNIQSMLSDPTERSYLVWLHDKATTIKQWQKDILKSLLHL